MTMNLNKIVLTKILDIMPENLKPVTLLMDVLDIGKESAYRRLRGEKPFSMEEIYKLSLVLNFSLDEIISNDKSDAAAFNHIGTIRQNPSKNLLEFFRYYESYLQRLIDSENSEITCTLNHFLHTMFINYEHLFKFIYYRWMHQMTDVPLNYLYSEVVIPKEIKESCERMSFLNTKIRNLSLIVDNNLFLNLIKEMQYFYVRGLLNEIELDTLKVELHKYLDDIETTINKGINTTGTQIEIYLSVLYINSTTTYATWDDSSESAFWHHYGYPIYTRNKEITARHKLWIDSLKKYCTVISQSNELLQAEFLNKQREYIDNIAVNILL